MVNNEDEYTDYSCSTSLERLARDVETLLRSWHVDDGSDRHVSISKQDARYFSIQAVPLIRSERLTWTLSFALSSNRRTTVSIELDLALWDAPPLSSPTSLRNVHGRGTNEKEASENEADLGNLPHSLRQKSQLREMPSHFFDSFSNLFGIGQHITLTPVTSSVLPDELLQYFAHSLIQRHDEDTNFIWVIGSTLSSWLQTALNCAVSSCCCCIPVFGIWGDYPSDPKQQGQRSTTGKSTTSTIDNLGKVQLFPPWMQLVRAQISTELEDLPALPMKMRQHHRKNKPYSNRKFVPPLLVGSVVPPRLSRHSPSSSPRTRANFCCHILQGRSQAIPMDSRLSMWGSILLQHCQDQIVHLWGARHVYSWIKPKAKKRSVFFSTFMDDGGDQDDLLHGWRRQKKMDKTAIANNNNSDEDMDVFVDGDDGTQDIYHYRTECRQYALSLLETVGSVTPSEPIWGPLDDPIKAVHATVTWNGIVNRDGVSEPLWSFRPLKIRSTSMSDEDWNDVEESVERTILDPSNSASFVIQTYYDHETLVASLAATQRCILAGLIRTATLPDEALLKHLTDEDLIETWDNEAGNIVAENLAACACVSRPTHALVDAMDWAASGDCMIHVWEAEEIVDAVMNGSLALGFPSPESYFSDNTLQETMDKAFAPLLKAAPVGRLLSILFVRMGQLRSPCSIALVWSCFVQELRGRWESQESLPNMNFISGIDHHPDTVRIGRNVSSIGQKANFAAILHCTEPDPDDQNCLIGQKLQVLNICVESLVAMGRYQNMQVEKQQPQLGGGIEGNDFDDNDGENATPARVMSDRSFDSTEAAENKAETSKLLQNGDSIIFTEKNDDNSISADKNQAKPHLSCTEAKSVADVTERLKRKGARCPVHDTNLLANGEQLYAPYRLRPFPLTDDVIAERILMLSRRSKAGRTSLRGRLEIAFRYQKPKLLSDMCAFKAANPGAIFQDFVNWYGNPANPLDDYQENTEIDSSGTGEPNVARTGNESLAFKLDKASEAILILEETREFWSKTWDEAAPQPASDQQPLFDLCSTVEMALDYFETMHPAILLNQIMAVNLSMAYFTLISSADDAIGVEIVRASFDLLRKRVERALQLLSKDVTNSTCISRSMNSDLNTHEGSSSFASLDAIAACEVACSTVSETEALTARAKSLIHKFPNQPHLVERILRSADGTEISIIDNELARDDLLRCIHQRQNTTLRSPSAVKSSNRRTVPTLREYLLCNTDESHPCQLSVRVGDELGMPDGTESVDSGLMIALTKSVDE